MKKLTKLLFKIWEMKLYFWEIHQSFTLPLHKIQNSLHAKLDLLLNNFQHLENSHQVYLF